MSKKKPLTIIKNGFTHDQVSVDTKDRYVEYLKKMK
jgi:hypothetical protein